MKMLNMTVHVGQSKQLIEKHVSIGRQLNGNYTPEIQKYLKISAKIQRLFQNYLHFLGQ